MKLEFDIFILENRGGLFEPGTRFLLMLSTNMDERQKDCDGACEAKNISQFAESVIKFSSQYGSETSISYTVPNLAANNTIYPSYGDFTQACVFVSSHVPMF